MRRITYRGTLRFPYGFHTGDGRRLGAVDQPLFYEPDGSVALAGSSLAGVLRADLERLARERPGAAGPCTGKPACRCMVCRLLGPRARDERGAGGEEAAFAASRLYVRGGRAEGPAGIRVRDRVGIDRRTRTAADKRKYDVELVDGEVCFPFELRLDDPEGEELLYLEAVLRRFAGGWLFAGGKSASGPGLAVLAELSRAELDLDRPEALVAYLLEDGPAAGAAEATLVGRTDRVWAEAWALPPAEEATGAASRGQVRLRLALHFPLGFLVNDPVVALQTGFDHAFTRCAAGRPVLPGSALRGALRSRGEQILRTLGGAAAACDLNRRAAACHEAVEKENQGRRQRGGKPLDFDEEAGRHCTACRIFGSGRLASPVRVTDFLPAGAAGEMTLGQEFVAVDRFTGGAAGGAKFNAEASAGVTLEGEIHLEIGPGRLERWGLGLLALVLRDLLLGDVPLGFGPAKGFNEYTAAVTAVDRFWLHPPEPLAGEPELAAPAGPVCWCPPAGRPLASPAAAAELAGELLGKRLRGWVAALHRHEAERVARRAEGTEGEEVPHG